MNRAVIVATVFLLVTGCPRPRKHPTTQGDYPPGGSPQEIIDAAREAIWGGILTLDIHTRADFIRAWGMPSSKKTRMEKRTIPGYGNTQPIIGPVTIEEWVYLNRNIKIDFYKSGKLTGFKPIDESKPVRYEE